MSIDGAKKIKRKQSILAVSLLTVIIGIIFGAMYMFDSQKGENLAQSKGQDKQQELKFSTPSDQIEPANIWRGQMQESQDQLQKQVVELTKALQEYQKEEQGKFTQLNNIVTELSHKGNKQELQQDQGLEGSMGDVQPKPEEEVTVSKIKRLKLDLAHKPKELLRTVDNSIPAGSFAKAVLLSGLDAIAAIKAAVDPRPLLVRIVDLGTLPRRFKTDLVDCHCIAGAWGELSSERIHARLEKLSCVERATGEIMELVVNGYIVGSDGREGIRGLVVSKDGQFLTRSLWGGVFSGVGNALSPNNRRNQMTPFMTIGEPNKEKTSDLLKSGFSESAANSLSKLSEYYIDRAEQIQPIIQVSAGQTIDLVFTDGISLDQTMYRQKLAERREQEITKEVNNLE